MDFKKLMNRGISQIKPYIAGKPKEVAEIKYNIKNPIKMNSNENPLGTSKVALVYASQALKEANIYPESSSRALRQALAKKISIAYKNIMIGNGSDEIFYYIAMGFINDNDEVIIPRTTFPIYETACRIMRASIIFGNMDGYIIDLKSILKKITHRTKMIFLCNPNNPTGHAFDNRVFFKFIKQVPPHIFIVTDEAYRDFIDMDDFPDSVSFLKMGNENLIITRTLSKSHGFAGLRIGYAIAHEGVIEILNRIRIPFNITRVSQYATLGALEDDDFLKQTIKITKEGRNQIYRACDRLGISYIRSHTNFILINTRKDSDFVTEELLKRGIIVRNAKNYGFPTSIRVTVGKEEQNEAFISAFKDVLYP